MRSLWFSVLVLSSHVFAQDAVESSQQPKDPLVTRRYILEWPPVYPSPPYGRAFGEAHFDVGANPFIHMTKDESGEANTAWMKHMSNPENVKAYFALHFDIPFPEGSWIRYSDANNFLTMHNTEQNHAWLRFALIKTRSLPSQVAITGRLVSFDVGELEKLDRESAASLDDAALLSLWRKGRGETIALQSLKTINGVNAIIECVDEVIYPTEMGSVNTNKVSQVLYGGFETREEGVILNVTPTVSAGAQIINLVLLPEKADLIGRNPQVPADTAPVTPTFQTFNITSSMIIRNGGTLVAGQSLSRDGKRRLVFFITATLCDAEGNIIVAPEE